MIIAKSEPSPGLQEEQSEDLKLDFPLLKFSTASKTGVAREWQAEKKIAPRAEIW
jgi:hypothetical protein